MSFNSKKILLFVTLLSVSLNAKAQVTQGTQPSTTPTVQSTATQDEMVEMQTVDGEIFLVRKKDLIKQEVKTEIKNEVVQTQVIQQPVTQPQTVQPPVIQPEVVQPQAQPQVVAPVAPVMTSEPTKNVQTPVQNQLSNSEQKNIQINVEAKNAPVSVETDDVNVILGEPSIVVPPVITPIIPTEPGVEAPELHKHKRFYVRGGFGLGTFTTISDVESNFSLGFTFGYEINHKFALELQYIYTDYEDTYNNGFYAYDSKFDQNDFALIANYKLLPASSQVQLRLRAGLNYAYRSYTDSYYGYKDSSDSMSFILGFGGDVRLTDDLSLTVNGDYYLNVSDNGYNLDFNALDLVAGEDYFNISLSLKYKF